MGMYKVALGSGCPSLSLSREGASVSREGDGRHKRERPNLYERSWPPGCPSWGWGDSSFSGFGTGEVRGTLGKVWDLCAKRWGGAGGLRMGLEREASPGPGSQSDKCSERVAVEGSVHMCVGGGHSWPSPCHPDSSSSYESGFPTGDHEFFTTFSWDDQKVRRVFIRKVTASPSSPRLGG